MAATSVPKPGSENGPCKTNCHHTDCKENRAMAARLCTVCQKPIGYETRFVRDNPEGVTDWTKLMHFSPCALERAREPSRPMAPIAPDGYPIGWPRCAAGCGRAALDGKATCGDARCGVTTGAGSHSDGSVR